MSFFGKDLKNARANYCRWILGCKNEKIIKEIEFENEKSKYISERKIIVRNFKTEDIMEFVASKMSIPSVLLHMKYSRRHVVARALTVVLMKNLCNLNANDICGILGNITPSRISKLCSIGIELINSEDKYENIVREFIAIHSV